MLSFFRPFLPVAIPPPEPPYSAIPTKDERRVAGTWWRSIADGIRSSSDRDNAIIRKVQWYKDATGLGQECLIFTVEVVQPSFICFLAIERVTKKEWILGALRGNDGLSALLPEDMVPSTDKTDREHIQNILRNKLLQELNLIQTRLDRYHSAPGRPSLVDSSTQADTLYAIDSITRVDYGYGVAPTSTTLKATCLLTLAFDTGKFCLRDIGIMAREVHNYQPSGSLQKHNSFWFARTLMDLIMAMKEYTFVGQNKSDLAGCLNLHPFRFIPAMKPNPVEIEDLIVKTKQAVINDDQRIEELLESREGRIAELQAALDKTRRDRDRAKAAAEDAVRRLRAQYSQSPASETLK